MLGNEEAPGIIPRLCKDLFDGIQAVRSGAPPPSASNSAGRRRSCQNNTDTHRTFMVEVSFMEIYNEKVRDLLAMGDQHQADSFEHLRVRQHPITGPFVEGLKNVQVTSRDQVLDLLHRGSRVRATAATCLNDTSSRSHAIFQLKFRQAETTSGDGEEHVLHCSSTISLVDLAGSERIRMSGATGQRFQEATHVNLSLHNLRKVIDYLIEHNHSHHIQAPLHARGKQALTTPRSLAPYRDSILTWLLSDSLGGNSKTIMMATISPAADCVAETVSTLRYAVRARRIVNHIRVNESVNNKLIRCLRTEITALQAKLKDLSSNPPASERSTEARVTELHEKIALDQQAIAELEEQQRQLLDVQRSMNLELQKRNAERERLEQALLSAEEGRQLLEGQKDSSVAALREELLRSAREHDSEVSGLKRELNETRVRHACALRQHNLDLRTVVEESEREAGVLRDLEAQLRQKNEEISQLTSELSLVREQKKSLEQMLATKPAMLTSSSRIDMHPAILSELLALREENETLRQRLGTGKPAVAESNVTKDNADPAKDLNSRLMDIVSELETVKKSNADLATNLHALVSVLSEKQAELTQARQRIRELESREATSHCAVPTNSVSSVSSARSRTSEPSPATKSNGTSRLARVRTAESERRAPLTALPNVISEEKSKTLRLQGRIGTEANQVTRRRRSTSEGPPQRRSPVRRRRTAETPAPDALVPVTPTENGGKADDRADLSGALKVSHSTSSPSPSLVAQESARSNTPGSAYSFRLRQPNFNPDSPVSARPSTASPAPQSVNAPRTSTPPPNESMLSPFVTNVWGAVSLPFPEPVYGSPSSAWAMLPFLSTASPIV
eukprot:TRINITY_DN7847_c0_g1_i2.p1 TRINITY_DN7847_c0_g1~~TRINITY_DN7847_c0_g1_i2.p1  ORF type:complete len:850 (+),score=91.22 TRINITY_DN7847_c0_g1_i2:34-2583(+)